MSPRCRGRRQDAASPGRHPSSGRRVPTTPPAAMLAASRATTERAACDDAERDEGERTWYLIATSTDHPTTSSANP